MARLLIFLTIISISLYSKERIYSIQLTASDNTQALKRVYENLPKKIKDKSIIYVTNSGKQTVRYLLSKSATPLKKVADNLKIDGLKGDFWVVNTDPTKAKEAFLKKYKLFSANGMTKEANDVAALLKSSFGSLKLPSLKESSKKPQLAKLDTTNGNAYIKERKIDAKPFKKPTDKGGDKIVESAAKKSETAPIESQKIELENIDELLKAYKSESELSKITKSESAGFLDIYTREELEKMQAHTLMDILKLMTIPFVTRNSNNATSFTKPTFSFMPPYAIRLYINDHDVTSTSFGSAMVLWGDMPIDHIDHIEIYKSASSVEFGNEAGTVIIKLYTKLPEREEGGKVRASVDQRGSYYTSAYYAHTTKSGLSYIFSANGTGIKTKEYENRGYELKSDLNELSLYLNIQKDGLRVEGASYKKEKGNFLGRGRAYTPLDGEIENFHNYIHIEKKFQNNLKISYSYDHLDFEEKGIDKSGIFAGAAGFVEDYEFYIHDIIHSFTAEKLFKHYNGELLVGAFYKKKKMIADGKFDAFATDFENTLNLYSLYLEDRFSINPTTTLIASFKGDYYSYDKEISSRKEHILRVGAIKNIGDFQLKAFYTKTYYALPFLALYGPDKAPYIADHTLKFPEPTLTSLGIRYKNSRHTIDSRVSLITVKNKVVPKPDGTLFNKDKGWYHQYEIKYEFKIDENNLFKADAYMGENSADIVMSPKYGGHIQLFNTIDRFEIYNQIGYRSNYEAYGVDVKPTFDYSASLKYFVSKDFSVGIKGENIFGTGYKQSYPGLDYAMPIFDRKYWLNLEYLF